MNRNSVAVAQNVIDTTLKDNTLKAISTVTLDAQFWLQKVTPNLFTWLPECDRAKVKIPKTLEEFWTLEPLHQDNVLAAW